MRSLKALLIADDKPGHYHLAEGVIAALSRLRPVETHRLEVRRHRVFPNRMLAEAFASGVMPASAVLRLAYGVRAESLPQADVVVSAGGDTIVPNAAAARVLGCPNIFCGSLRRLGVEHFGLVVSSYQSHEALPKHLVTLKPNAMDPDAAGRRARKVLPANGYPPLIGLLIGGNSGLFRYTSEEWTALARTICDIHRAGGTRWIVSTSRRTPAEVADRFVTQATSDPAIAQMIDYRSAGPGSLAKLFGEADAILATEDSSTMISEAISQRLPVVGVAPSVHGFKTDEAEYRALMIARDWCRFMGLAELTPERFREALGQIRPMTANHLDELARQLATRLPGLTA